VHFLNFGYQIFFEGLLMRSTTMDQEDRDKGGGQGDLQGIARMSRVRN